jgi:hypothetical protein
MPAPRIGEHAVTGEQRLDRCCPANRITLAEHFVKVANKQRPDSIFNLSVFLFDDQIRPAPRLAECSLR